MSLVSIQTIKMALFWCSKVTPSRNIQYFEQSTSSHFYQSALCTKMTRRMIVMNVFQKTVTVTKSTFINNLTRKCWPLYPHCEKITIQIPLSSNIPYLDRVVFETINLHSIWACLYLAAQLVPFLFEVDHLGDTNCHKNRLTLKKIEIRNWIPRFQKILFWWNEFAFYFSVLPGAGLKPETVALGTRFWSQTGSIELVTCDLLNTSSTHLK